MLKTKNFLYISNFTFNKYSVNYVSKIYETFENCIVYGHI